MVYTDDIIFTQEQYLVPKHDLKKNLILLNNEREEKAKALILAESLNKKKIFLESKYHDAEKSKKYISKELKYTVIKDKKRQFEYLLDHIENNIPIDNKKLTSYQLNILPKILDAAKKLKEEEKKKIIQYLQCEENKKDFELLQKIHKFKSSDHYRHLLLK